ncbi:hypothetical protein [Cognatiyoonia sp. IB215182]|uniref:hypothetical protein n=1 Tax=Cognatiyoonia sp. IB215182 TaxID=3097353 RepID=UPI002A117177|nr:hypothetical protein [Cognatiyoonia sp. IB215182]MDX8351682.1 hypothetical protein [Cognatiyoonia sp. IB215182]
MKRTIEDTDKSRNLQVAVSGKLSLEAMETVLTAVGEELGLELTHATTLSRKKYPNNRHWHFKEDRKRKGCLDVTYWPEGKLFWITVRNYEPEWVHRSGQNLAELLSKRPEL